MTVNQQTLAGNWNEIKGKLRDRWGQLSGDELESAHGNVEQLVGTIQRTTGEAREAVETYLEELTKNSETMMAQAAETVRDYAHTAQDVMHDVTKQAADTAKTGYKQTELAVRKHPFESVAVCFGTGLITGVVVGLMLRSK